jgi:hypothetical protein
MDAFCQVWFHLAHLFQRSRLKYASFFPDAHTFHNIYKLQKHVLLRHQSYLIIFMGNKNLRLWQIMSL